MFEKSIGEETRQLMYLKLAENLGWHITDFMDSSTEEQFNKQHLFYFFKPIMYDIIRGSTDMRSWAGQINEAYSSNFRALSTDMTLILRQAEEVDEEANVETVCMYIGSNEYLYFCYEKLVKYVERFTEVTNIRIDFEESDERKEI